MSVHVSLNVCFSLPVDTSGSVHKIAEFCSLVFCLENPQTTLVTCDAK